MVFLFCAVCTRIVIPHVLFVAISKKLFDESDERKIHRFEIPRLGGVAFSPVVLFSIALLLGLNMVAGNMDIWREVIVDMRPMSFGFCAVMILYMTGMKDDLVGVNY